MIRLVWALLCRSSAVDRDSNSLSIFDVAEELTLLEPINSPGAAAFPLQLVSLWTRVTPTEAAKALARVTLLLPSGKPATKLEEFQVDLTEFLRLRHRLTMGMFPIVEAGVHEMLIEIQQQDGHWNEASRVPFELKVAEQPKAS